MESPDLEVARYALRSFALSTPTADQELANKFGFWSDGLCRVWRAPTYQHGTDWEDGTCVAVCRKSATGWKTSSVLFRHLKPVPVVKQSEPPHHPAPDESCSCGIYGSLSYADLIKQFGSYAPFMVSVIAAEGATIIGDRGLRTAFARVVAYWTDPDPLRRVSAAKQFREAKVFESPFDMVSEYGVALLPPGEASRDLGAGMPKWWTGKGSEL